MGRRRDEPSEGRPRLGLGQLVLGRPEARLQLPDLRRASVRSSRPENMIDGWSRPDLARGRREDQIRKRSGLGRDCCYHTRKA